ncbi:MAG: tRNA (N(6)-L-threonylcarbamoyladenosine(37)-C(2))-methylthiotransferase MtaB [Magnetococcales bacterium]|nr:tRNA (N(6)-L-threonylcarbamoyladenosine(37)-C(2))-methylthiotransferase MtaB [Magnetococcales bacterium]
MNKRKNYRPMSVITMGCRVNQFETELLRHGGFERGFYIAKDIDDVELIIVNTCSVTSESDRQARQLIRRAAKDNPQAKIVVTGCYAQRTPEILSQLPQVALVLGNQEKSELWSYVDTLYHANGKEEVHTPHGDGAKSDIDAEGSNTTIHVGKISELEMVPSRPVVDTFSDRARAFLQLQDGCDRSCTYCLIPSVRGPSRSLTSEQILAQAERFVASGFNELVLTGIDLGSYGLDLSPAISLADIISKILNIPGVGRIRLSSIDPADIDDKLLDLLASEDKICAYLHLSIQSGDDMILKRMGRRSDSRGTLDKIKQIKKARPQTEVGADLIVGFPTESDEAFQNSLKLVEEGRLVFLHIFRYSDRPGTPAAKIPSNFRVSGVEAKKRSEILRKAGETNLSLAALDRFGQTDLVLIESIEGGFATGKTDSFLPVKFAVKGGEKVGELMKIRLKSFDSINSHLGGVVQ